MHLADAELERLDTLLAPLAPRALDASGVQGLSAALVLLPEMVMPSVWMARVWDADRGRHAPVFDSLAEANEAMALLMRLYNEVAQAIGAAGHGDLQPLCSRDDRWSAASFCRGFKVGLGLGGVERHWRQGPQAPWLEAFDAADPLPAALRQSLHALAALAYPALALRRGDDPWELVRGRLEVFESPFPAEVVAIVLERREALAPRFIEVLEALVADPDAAMEAESMLHYWAVVFLGGWRDTRAWRPMLAIARLPYETLDFLLGDALFETFGRALASVCPGDVEPLREIAEDESVSNWVRMTVLDAWRLRVTLGDAALPPFEDALQRIGERNAEALRRGERRDDEPEIIDDIASQVCDVGSERLHALVLGWFDERLIDESAIDRAFFESEMALTEAERRALLERRHNGYLGDPETEIGWWAMYHEDDRASGWRPPPAPTTIVREGPKIGRNDPCPCGSGRKYKKCHGAN